MNESATKVRCAFDRMVKVTELTPHSKNPNAHPQAQIERLARILEFQGFRSPIVVSNRSGCIVAGHGRLEAAKLLGWREVPVNFQDFESDEAEYAHLVADNAVADWSDLDLAAINADIGDLGPDFDIDLLGIERFEIEVADKDDSEESKPKGVKIVHCPQCGEAFDANGVSDG